MKPYFSFLIIIATFFLGLLLGSLMRYDEVSITNFSAAIGRSGFAGLYASVYVPDTLPPWEYRLMQGYLSMRSFLGIENTYDLPDYATTTQYGLEQVYFCKPLAERFVTYPLMTFGSYVLVNNTSLWYRDQLVASYYIATLV